MTRLTLLQLNDLHGYLRPHPELLRTGAEPVFRELGGVARIAAVFNRVRDENPGAVLALDNGDTFHGTRLAVESRGLALTGSINALGLSAMTLHWEFAWSPTGVRELQNRISHPLLACNCFDSTTGKLFLEPWHMVERAGLRIAVIGLACPIIDKVMPPEFSEGVHFTMGNEELPGHVAAARAAGADLIVLLSHAGFPQDVKLAGEVPGLDVILSGHTHNRLWQPFTVNGTVIMQSGCHGSFIGRLDLDVGRHGITSWRHELIPVGADVAEDPHVARLVGHAVKQEPAGMDDVIGRVAAPLHRYAQLNAPMDDLLLEAVAAAAGTELAFSNGWRYGAPVPPGPVTVRDVWNIIPVNPGVLTTELTGAELTEMLEENLENTFAADPYRQMGGYVKRMRGIRLYAKLENPSGARIAELFVNGEPVDPEATYKCAFVTEQGVPRKYGRNRTPLGVDAVSALLDLFDRQHEVDLPRSPSVLAV